MARVISRSLFDLLVLTIIKVEVRIKTHRTNFVVVSFPIYSDRKWHELLYKLKEANCTAGIEWIREIIGEFDWNGPYPKCRHLMDCYGPFATTFCLHCISGRMIFSIDGRERFYKLLSQQRTTIGTTFDQGTEVITDIILKEPDFVRVHTLQ